MTGALTLDVLRHGQAVASHPGGDAARALSPQGRDELERLAQALAEVRYDRVFASPLVRAQESAAIVTRGIGRIDTLDELVPEANPSDLLDALERVGVAGGHVLLVTHQPLVGRLSAWLTGRERMFAPASLARIVCTKSGNRWSGRLEWDWHAGAATR